MILKSTVGYCWFQNLVSLSDLFYGKLLNGQYCHGYSHKFTQPFCFSLLFLIQGFFMTCLKSLNLYTWKNDLFFFSFVNFWSSLLLLFCHFYMQKLYLCSMLICAHMHQSLVVLLFKKSSFFILWSFQHLAFWAD